MGSGYYQEPSFREEASLSDGKHDSDLQDVANMEQKDEILDRLKRQNPDAQMTYMRPELGPPFTPSSRFKTSTAIGRIASAIAKAQGQEEFGVVLKNLSATIQMKSGGRFSYTYADLASVIAATVAFLAKEGVATMQFPDVRLDEAPPVVVVTTFLSHASGEWLSSEAEVPLSDPTDARAVGSAITYARRYGLSSMLCIASEEDDDAQAARGHDGEQEGSGSSAPPKECPVCHKKGTIIKGREEFGGGWLCWKGPKTAKEAKKGCGAKWGDDDDLTQPPPDELMPKSTKETKSKGKAADVPPEVEQVAPGAFDGLFDQQQAEPAEKPAEQPYAAVPPGERNPQEFEVEDTQGKRTVKTLGMTYQQYTKAKSLMVKVSLIAGRRNLPTALLAEVFGIDAKDETNRMGNLTESQAKAWIERLEENAK